MPKGIHTRGTPTGVHTVDFLIWIPDYHWFRRDSEFPPTALALQDLRNFLDFCNNYG